MSNLIIGGPLLFSEPDCPTREGEVVDTLEDIYNIPSPRVGMRVFVKDTKKSYIVTKLKEEDINGVSVPNAKVDEFEDIQPDVAGMNDAIQANTTAIADEKDRAISAETILDDKIRNINNSISTLNRTIINYNTRYGIAGAVTKQQVIEDLLNRGTADKGCIVTYYAEDGWHTIQYKLNYYNPTQGVKESNWVEIVNEDTIKDIKDSIDNVYVKPEGGIPNTDLSEELQKSIDNAYVKPKGGIPKNDLSTEVQEAINNAGEIADGAVTERKLSLDVKDKLNTAYDKANLVDTLFVNDGIELYKGALQENKEPYGTSYEMYSNKILANGEKVVLANGFKFTSYKVFEGDTEIFYSTFGGNELILKEKGYIYQLGIAKSNNGSVASTDFSKVIKSFIRKPYTWDDNSNLNNFICAGRYTISGSREANANDNIPIYNGGNIEARLEVLENGNTLVQILSLLNVGGGDGNIYTRTRQNGSWGAWGKLQTNIEVGLIGVGQSKTFDDFTDNGMYSGVNAYWVDAVNYITSVETFVLVVINAYLYGGGIAQLKYSTLLDGTTTVKIRTRVNDSWGEWQSIGGDESSYTLPVATADVLGGVKVTKDALNASGLKVDDGQLSLNQGGIKCITPALGDIDDERLLNIREGGIYTGGLYDGNNLCPFTLVVSYNLKKGGGSGLNFILQQLTYVKDGNIVTLNRMLSANESDNTIAIDWRSAVDTSIVNQIVTTATIAPNVLNIWGEVTQLDITLADADATKVNEYMFQFTSGATATTLILPSEIKWMSAPKIQANKVYQISIVNNLAVIGEFSHE